MSELNQDELSTLKARADLLGIQYHPSIGLEKLKEKLNAVIADTPKEEAAPVAVVTPGKESEAQMLQRLREEQMTLIRIRIACMNPNKAEWQGELFTFGNTLVGTHTKFVPFNAEDGWHVPKILLDLMTERQCQIFVVGKTRNGVTTRQGKLIKEFSIEILAPLTQEELRELAQRQALTESAD